MMDNGAGYIAMRHEMPGVTVDMVDWWFAWHPIEGLRYRIWYPPYHLGVHVDDWAQPRLLDPGVLVRDKCEKIVHHVTEDTGMGTEHIDIHFLTPEQMGFDMSRWQEPNVGTFVGGFGWSLNEHQPPEIPAAPAIMVHFIREIDGGVEWRTRFWMGYTTCTATPCPCCRPASACRSRPCSASPTTISTSTRGSSRCCRSCTRTSAARSLDDRRSSRRAAAGVRRGSRRRASQAGGGAGSGRRLTSSSSGSTCASRPLMSSRPSSTASRARYNTSCVRIASCRA